MILLDYDGTLTSSHRIPDFARPSSRVLAVLKKLNSLPDTYVYILSGRGRMHMDKWFEVSEVGLSAEHGCFYKHPDRLRKGISQPPSGAKSDTNGWFCLVNQFDTSWKEIIRPLFQHYTSRTPGSFIEEKEINLTWHYRNSDPEFGSWQATELQVNLEKLLSHMAVSIILGNKTLELRPSSVDKATAAKAILRDLHMDQGEIDFLLCIGDGRTDEVVFTLLHETPYALSATVGKKRTEASFYLDNVQEVEEVLSKLAETSKQ